MRDSFGVILNESSLYKFFGVVIFVSPLLRGTFKRGGGGRRYSGMEKVLPRYRLNMLP